MSLHNSPDTTGITVFPGNQPPDQWTRESFWAFADRAKEETEALAARHMAVIPQLSIEQVRQICIQYRFFTIDYISDLSLLLAKLPFGGLRSLLAHILSEELGEGDAHKAHPDVYDRFLASIGTTAEQREYRLPANEGLLNILTAELRDNGAAFGVGLRGMGGECLCQTYLATMFDQMCAHPWFVENKSRIDWDFWTIHAGEADIIHGEMTRKAIDDYIIENPEALPELARGYERSISVWNQFWHNIFAAANAIEHKRSNAA